MQHAITRLLNGHRSSLLASLLLPTVLCLGCGGPAPLTIDMPLHLEDHLDAATIVGSEVPAELLEPVEWHFDEPQPDWKPVVPLPSRKEPVQTEYTENVLRLTLTEANRSPDGLNWFCCGMWGAIYVDLPDHTLADWGTILVRARTSDEVRLLDLAFNLREPSDSPIGMFGFAAVPQHPSLPVINDGVVHTYAQRTDPLGLSDPMRRNVPASEWGHPWRQLAIVVGAAGEGPASFDLLSVTMVPKAALYGEAVGLRTEIRGDAHRRALYTHAPGRVEYRVRLTQGARLDVGLGVIGDDVPVKFQIKATPIGGEEETLLDETYSDKENWAQRSVNLSYFAGRTITLALQAEAEVAGTVALWAAPTLSGARVSQKPNIIFYVIDGGGADYMSVYGYNRRTTPNLERLAAEGALFEHAYSNSAETSVSTPSFMTSLHTSVMGGMPPGDQILPEQEVTMAQRLHRAGFQTAVFTSNVSAGTETGLERGVDVLRDAHVQPNSASSTELHDDYWSWREAYPGEPYWVHFQTTDVHWPWTPVAPFAGLFVSPDLRESYDRWERQAIEAVGRRFGRVPDSAALAERGINPVMYVNARRGLYDESMARQDDQLGRLVERLRARGEWEHTLLIVAADHSTYAAGLRDPLSLTAWDPIFRSSVSRVPLLIVWPGRISGGQRFSQPVSMIDVLPTILDLVDLPMPEVMQGQSLAPLLFGEEGWEPRPVILDEFWVDAETSELRGVIEVVDGRWGASLEINPDLENLLHREGPNPWSRRTQRTVPLLLYDLWNDPYTQHSLHEERPDLVEKYTKFLEAQFEAHRLLAQFFTHSPDQVALTPEQLQTLRALGYIQ